MRTKLGAKNESSMDNSPIHDEAQYDPKSGCLDAYDVGLNSLLALDGEVLEQFARHRGDDATADRLAARVAELRDRIAERLWDTERSVFANRRWSGGFVRSIAPTSFYPMLAGAADLGQQAHLLQWLQDPKTFGGANRLPSVARNDPSYHDNVYWRGRVWPPLNYLTYNGLKRCGHEALAADLAADSVRLFAAAWARRQMPENFSAETGIADDQPDTDTFYGWGGLMPLIGINAVIDVTPWSGWEINPRPRGASDSWRLGPLLAFGKQAELASEGGWLTLSLDGATVFRTDIATRLFWIVMRPDGLDLETHGGGTVALPGKTVTRAKFGAHELAVEMRAGAASVRVPTAEIPRRLELRWS
jgi:putative isomerase